MMTTTCVIGIEPVRGWAALGTNAAARSDEPDPPHDDKKKASARGSQERFMRQ
jgi:hypothetical protein